VDERAWSGARGREGGSAHPSLPPALVAVRSGGVTVSTPPVTPGTDPAVYFAGPGAVFGAADVIAERPASVTLVAAATPTVVLRMPPSLIADMAVRFPGAEREILVGAVDAGASAAADAAAAAGRAAALQPCLVAAPKRGIVGRSPYADRLRRAVVVAARDTSRRAVIVYGEPGLDKANVVALIHHGSPDRAKPLIEVDAARLGSGAELFGRGARRGLLASLGDGSLLLNNVHLVRREERGMVGGVRAGAREG